MPKSAARTIAPDDVKRFSGQADSWWSSRGVFEPLHALNPVRLGYIRDQALRHFGRTAGGHQPLAGLSVLDVGCGGGLVAEPLARLGANVRGVDASVEGITEARRHAKTVGLSIDYQATDIESVAATGKRYDIVTALEIVEHVADRDVFLASLATLVKPGGLLIMSTLNRTAKSFLLGIVVAEYLVNWVPRGTHDWKQFVRPSELADVCEKHGLRLGDLTGIHFDPLQNTFALRRGDVGVNYLITFYR